MKIYTVTMVKKADYRDCDVLVIASSIEKAQELAQLRAHSKGLHIYLWSDNGREGYASEMKYVIKEYMLDDTNQ